MTDNTQDKIGKILEDLFSGELYDEVHGAFIKIRSHKQIDEAKAALTNLIEAEVVKGRIDELKNWRARTFLTANDPLNIRTEIEARLKILQAQQEVK